MPSPETLDLVQAYQQYFEIVPAYTEALKDEVYQIRHKVYCEDLAFEPQRPDRREHDAYDAQSLHLLIRSVRSGQFIGCTRIVLTRPNDPYHPLPFEKACGATLDRSVVDPARLPRKAIAEVSRLAVVAQFRRRKEDSQKSPVSISEADFGTTEQPRFPYIPIGLYLGSVELARLNNVNTLFVLTEPRLASHFQKLGFNIRPIGAPVEHRGARIPSVVDTTNVANDLRTHLRPLYHVIAAEVSSKSLLDTSR
jgi:N-acyl amino acid synthase of PEP-CTERM/exosortase system